MRTLYMNIMNKGCQLIVFIVLFFIFFSGMPILAQEHGEDGEHGEHGEGGSNWMLMLGAGGGVTSKYSGSDEVKFIPIPYVNARYKTNYLDFFLHIEEGLGVTLKMPEYTRATLSLGGSWAEGEGRNHDDMDFLEGTPDIKSYYQLIGSLKIPLPVGDVSSKVRYHPLTTEYEEAERSDEDYTGVVVDLDWKHEWWVKFPYLMLEIKTGLSWMNDEYAQAHYNVDYPTEELEVFSAESGIRDVHFSVTSITMFSRHLGVGILGSARHLLYDAADTPLTKERLQPFGGLFVFYYF